MESHLATHNFPAPVTIQVRIFEDIDKKCHLVKFERIGGDTLDGFLFAKKKKFISILRRSTRKWFNLLHAIVNHVTNLPIILCMVASCQQWMVCWCTHFGSIDYDSNLVNKIVQTLSQILNVTGSFGVTALIGLASNKNNEKDHMI